MPEYIVTRKTDGAEIYRYNADAPIEWSGMEFTGYDHIEAAPVVSEPTQQVDPTRWKIYVGSFFDRFGAAKLAILSDPDPVVQAVIKDASVRNYIDLLGRRDELLQVIGLLNLKGHAVDATAVLDLEPTDDEVWRGN
ncbi:MAG: hypothetical protein ACKO0Z_02700 [Betaproteobacteria bacterium]